MHKVGNAHLSATFADTGITLQCLRDESTGFEYLTDPSILFKFAVDNGPTQQSDENLVVDDVLPTGDGSSLTITARTVAYPLTFELEVAVETGAAVLIVRLAVTNTGPKPLWLRMVLPDVLGLRTPGSADRRLGMVPTEIGSLAPLRWPGVSLGMPLDLDVGLPNGMNALEVACVFDGDGHGGVFFADVDGDIDTGVPPLQFVLTSTEVAGFFVATLDPSTRSAMPRLAVGVHSAGDWHVGVDWYVAAHRPRWEFKATPAWFREAGAIYTFGGGGAGSIYLDPLQSGRTALPSVASVADGQVWVSFERGDQRWTDGGPGRAPRRASPAGFAPAGAALCATNQDAGVDVFAVGADGAVWVTFQRPGAAWTDGNGGREPLPVSPPAFAPAGAPLAVIEQDGGIDALVVTHGRLRTFLDLPNLLAEARVFGSDVIYLWDYWEGTIAGDDPPYWNKGDYRPRADLGGAPALIEGIQRVHGNGGRVVLYLEPFIIYEQSDIGGSVGADWQALDANGKPLTTIYPGNFKMVAPLNDWQDYVVSVAKRLVCTYGADGILLDSYGWQMNQRVKAQAENRLYSPLEHSQGVLRLTDRVRQAVQAIKADAVVLGETAAGPIGRHWDGGLAADFGFAALTNSPPRLPASPVRYAVPEIAWYSNGLKLSELHQVFAAGHGLALCSAWPGSWMYDNAHHIRKLVEIRQQHADALVYGQQSYQPQTGTDNVVAYRYHGTQSDLLTIVNMDDGSSTSVDLVLQSKDRDTRWLDLLDPSTMKASGETLQGVSLAAGDIRVLELQTD